MTQADSGKKSQNQIYGEVVMDIGYTLAGVVAGTVASYQVKKLAMKAATPPPAGQAAEPSLIAKLSPTLVGAAATYGAVASKDRGMRMFFIGMAAAASSASLYNLAGNEITAKYAGQQLLGATPDEEVVVLPTRRGGMSYQASDAEDVEFEDLKVQESDYQVNLPAALQTQPQYNDMQGLGAAQTDGEDAEYFSTLIV